MTTWSSGYVADIGYTFGYYAELNPLRTRLALLAAGLTPPKRGLHCELGFGQGLSVNIHAAASGDEWYATDFNPSQASFALALAEASGAAGRLFDQSFAEFCARSDLPEFDSIGLHGIWSWISDENRQVIVDFVRRKLKVGGALYISYNTLPGWAAFAPMRHLMCEHTEKIGAEGRGIVSRINEAVDFAEKLLTTNPAYARANPQVAERIRKIKDQNRHYLAHEYFNRDWHPMHFSTLAEWLEPAKVQFACSANFLDHLDQLNLTAEQQAFLKEIPDRMFRESVRDFMVNQQFRRDYWIKGSRPLSGIEQNEALRAQGLILLTPVEDVHLTVNGVLGEAKLSEAIYKPILDLLADHRPRTLGEIASELQAREIRFNQVVQAILVLVGAGHVAPTQDEASIERAQALTERLNDHITARARTAGELNFLASPVTGGGIGIGRFQQLFLRSLKQGERNPSGWVDFAERTLVGQGQRMLKDGKAVESREETLRELQAIATTFEQKQLPMLRALGIA